jgi:hypothetical protein
MPLLLFVAFAILQLSMLFVADSVMQYAAFAAARSEMVRGVNTHESSGLEVDPQRAAAMVTSLISYGEATTSAIEIPGFGQLNKSDYSQENTDVEIEDLGDGAFEAIVRFKYKFLFPVMSLNWLGLQAVDFGELEDGKLLLEKRHRMVRSAP